jgi:DNA-binding protein HU-beta
MNKAELVQAVASNKKAGIASRAAADRAVNAVLDAIRKALKKDKNVSIAGFGTFKVKKRSARMGRNPQTGASIKIPARNAITFKAGSELKKSV